MKSFPVLLTVLLIGLKLTGHIAWSWVWVLSPMWVLFVIVFLCGLILLVLDKPEKRKFTGRW